MLIGERIPLADIYYKIEDKWFDLLDWLEAHGIPVYKIIDPLEKRGIPSLPVFVAILLILIYAIFATLGGGGGFTLCIKDGSGKAVSDAGLTIFSGSSAIASGTTDSNGCYRSALSIGGYTAKISKSTCDSNPHSFNVSDPGGSATVTVSCGASLSRTFCIYPADSGNVTVTVRDQNLNFLTSFNCGTTSCTLSMEPNRYYTFSTDAYMSERYSYNDLNSMTQGHCIQFGEQDQAEEGTFTVEVVDGSDDAIEDADVELVDPDDNETLVVNHKLTNEYGKAVFTGDVGEEFRVHVTPPSSMSLASYLDSDVDSFAYSGGYRKVTLTASVSSLTLLVKNSTDPLRGVRITVFSEYGSEFKHTNSSGGVAFGVVGGKTFRVALFKEEYEYTEVSMRSG